MGHYHPLHTILHACYIPHYMVCYMVYYMELHGRLHGITAIITIYYMRVTLHACCTGVALVITRSIVVYYMSGVHHLSAGQAAAVLMDSGTISWPRN